MQEYNTQRPHQSLGDRPPVERFRLAARRDAVELADEPVVAAVSVVRPASVSRWVNQRGQISLAGFSYRVGPTFAVVGVWSRAFSPRRSGWPRLGQSRS